MWPEPVERIAAFLRASGVHGRLEQLPPGVDEPPGPAVRAAAFECDRRILVVLFPDGGFVDRDKLAAVAGCAGLHPAPLPAFPFQTARVFLDRSVVGTGPVWLEAGSERHFVGLPPSELVRLARAETADLLIQGEVGRRGQG
jgi:prolyl-tRNA editing enzyme YbaK/EbsC (Cys-tRNA(Pro) deacylase)